LLDHLPGRARLDLPDDVLAAKPASGGIVAMQVDVAGVPVARFAG